MADYTAYKITCSDTSGQRQFSTDYEDFWVDPEMWKGCEVAYDEEIVAYRSLLFSPHQLDAINANEVFAPGYGEEDVLLTLIDICAVANVEPYATPSEIGIEVDPSRYIAFPRGAGAERIRSLLKNALVLCPDAPHASVMTDEIAKIEQFLLERDVMFAEKKAADDFLRASTISGGTFNVGSDIQPGTYVYEGSVTNCYWARLDSSGGIIANEWIPNANRVEITVFDGDYSLDVHGCGRLLRPEFAQ